MKFHENPYSGSRVLYGRTDGRTDMFKLTVAFRNFVNAPNLAIIPSTVLTIWPLENWRFVSCVSRTPFCGPGSIPGQIFRHLRWKKSHLYLLFSEYFAFPLLVRFHQSFTLVFICTTSLKGRTNGRSMGNFH